MKISAIDIGSNSVRLATIAGGKTLYKHRLTTRLGENLAFSGMLAEEAIERSAKAVADFVKQAEDEGVQKIYAFATAAVRSAGNGQAFVSRVKELCGADVRIISGEEEARIGLLGALGYSDGGMIDLGGASTEVTVQKDGATVYARSVDIGTVRLCDMCGYDRIKLEEIIREKLEGYGDFTAADYDMYGVSGTATSLAAVKQGLSDYDPDVVHGTVLSVEDVERYADLFLGMSPEAIREKFPVIFANADIIGGGSLLLARLMQRLKIKKITVSENDNLEGYVIYREGAL